MLWRIMLENGYPPHLVNCIKELYINSQIAVKTQNKTTQQEITNQGVRQGCSLSPTLFNIYMDVIIRDWKRVIPPGINIGKGTCLNTLLYADDQVIIQETEDDLQLSLYRLNQICEKYNFEISQPKTNIMAFKGKDPIRSKIVLRDTPVQQVAHFHYLGCDITYEEDREIDRKITKFQKICGTILRTLKGKTRKDTLLRFYNVMAIPQLLYGSETWVHKQKHLKRTQAAEMKFLRAVKGCTLHDHIRNEDIQLELNVNETINEKMKKYKTQWLAHVQRMNNDRIPLQCLNYRPCGKRCLGRPRKRWIQEAGTG